MQHGSHGQWRTHHLRKLPGAGDRDAITLDRERWQQWRRSAQRSHHWPAGSMVPGNAIIVKADSTASTGEMLAT